MGPVKQSFDLKDKVAVITGGAGMLGEKHAEAIAEFGGIPILLDIDEKSGTEKTSMVTHNYQVGCEFKLCDITDESQISSVRDFLLNKFGRIDILINNAAIDPKVEEKNDKNLSSKIYCQWCFTRRCRCLWRYCSSIWCWEDGDV